MTTVIYHADCADGFTAAFCAWRRFGDTARYVPAHYGDKPPDCAGDDVFVVDFSYPRATLESLRRTTASLLVLDHHKSARADLEGLDYCKFDMARSGAALAEAEFCSGQSKLVAYVQDRDLWTWALPNSREVSAYIAAVPRNFAAWLTLARELENDTADIVNRGSGALATINAYVIANVSHARKVEIGGHIVPCINTTFAISELIGELAEDSDFAVGWFQRQDGMFVYSLRSRGDFDVSEIAKMYGGGGHKRAAGFTVEAMLP